MKKELILRRIIIIIAILLAINLVVHFIFFQRFQNHTKQITETEKKEILQIIEQSLKNQTYEINFGKAYLLKNKNFVQIELIQNNSKKEYLVDLENKRLIKK